MTDINGSFVYNPYSIAKYATQIYCYWYYTNDSTPLTEFQSQIKWIRDNETKFGDHSIWTYGFDNPYSAPGRDTDPWWSSLANGFVIASLLESYALYGNATDKQIAWRGLKSFGYSLQNHGFVTNWNGTNWYEEEADNTSLVIQTPSHILNGMLFSVGCARYVYDFNGSAYALTLFNDGIAAVKAHARQFDTGMWEKYSIIESRVTPYVMILHASLFNWAKNITDDPILRSWWIRTEWMSRLPSLGYTPSYITANNTIDPIGWGTDRLIDKQLTIYVSGKYWSSFLPATITFDLGSNKPVNFIGYYGIELKSAPKNYTVYTSIDGINWAISGTVQNSTDQNKCLTFDDPIQVHYVRFTFQSTIGNTNVVGLDEVIIANLTADDFYEANLSIRDHRFKNVDGRLTGTAPAGTIIRIDDGSNVTLTGNYSFWLEDGMHDILLEHNGLRINKTFDVRFAKTIYYNVTDQTFIDFNSIGNNESLLIAAIVIVLFSVPWIFIYFRRKKDRPEHVEEEKTEKVTPPKSNDEGMHQEGNH